MIYYLLSLIILNNKRKKLNNKVLSVCISSISNRLYFISGNFLNENKIIYMQKKRGNGTIRGSKSKKSKKFL